MKRLFYILMLGFGLAVLSCGDPTDDPEDCSDNEYFDPSDEQCRTCEPVEEPECPAGCGFSLGKDDVTECPIAVCNLECDDLCADGQQWSDESLSCVDCPRNADGDPVCTPIAQ